jgi:CRISPR/Cas system-associated exonuclease Cas4 (RecB family)
MLESLAPARLERLLSCPLRVAFEQAGEFGGRKSSSAALVGRAVHRTIELVLSRKEGVSEEVGSAWEEACDELAAEGEDPRALPTARRARLRLEARLPELRDFVAQRLPAELLLEETLTSVASGLTGTPDLLIVGSSVVVVDYKTGVVAEEEVLEPGYRRQVALYAWLAAERFGTPVDGALFSLRQGIIPVDTSTDEVNDVARTALEARAAFNARVPGPQPAAPSEAACGRCPHVCKCDEAWAALIAGEVARLGWGEAVRGALDSDVLIAGSGMAALVIGDAAGTQRGRVSIIDVPGALVTGCVVGDEVALAGLGIRSSDPIALRWITEASQFARLV